MTSAHKTEGARFLAELAQRDNNNEYHNTTTTTTNKYNNNNNNNSNNSNNSGHAKEKEEAKRKDAFTQLIEYLNHLHPGCPPDPMVVGEFVAAGADPMRNIPDPNPHNGVEVPLLHRFIERGHTRAVLACLSSYPHPIDFTKTGRSRRWTPSESQETTLHRIASGTLSDQAAEAMLAALVDRLQRHPEDIIQWDQVNKLGETFLERAAAHQRLALFWPHLQHMPYFADRETPWRLPLVWRWDLEAVRASEMASGTSSYFSVGDALEEEEEEERDEPGRENAMAVALEPPAEPQCQIVEASAATGWLCRLTWRLRGYAGTHSSHHRCVAMDRLPFSAFHSPSSSSSRPVDTAKEDDETTTTTTTFVSAEDDQLLDDVEDDHDERVFRDRLSALVRVCVSRGARVDFFDPVSRQWVLRQFMYYGYVEAARHCLLLRLPTTSASPPSSLISPTGTILTTNRIKARRPQEMGRSAQAALPPLPPPPGAVSLSSAAACPSLSMMDIDTYCGSVLHCICVGECSGLELIGLLQAVLERRAVVPDPAIDFLLPYPQTGTTGRSHHHHHHHPPPPPPQHHSDNEEENGSTDSSSSSRRRHAARKDDDDDPGGDDDQVLPWQHLRAFLNTAAENHWLGVVWAMLHPVLDAEATRHGWLDRTRDQGRNEGKDVVSAAASVVVGVDSDREWDLQNPKSGEPQPPRAGRLIVVGSTSTTITRGGVEQEKKALRPGWRRFWRSGWRRIPHRIGSHRRPPRTVMDEKDESGIPKRRTSDPGPFTAAGTWGRGGGGRWLPSREEWYDFLLAEACSGGPEIRQWDPRVMLGDQRMAVAAGSMPPVHHGSRQKQEDDPGVLAACAAVARLARFGVVFDSNVWEWCE